MKFIEFCGNASTTASLRGVRLGHDVSVAVYQQDDQSVSLQLESNGSRVKGVSDIKMTNDDYANFKSEAGFNNIMIKALELFNVKTSFSK